MDGPRPYDIVVSLHGHDAGRLYMVAGAEENRLLLCDGRLRRLDNPKRKSPRHVRVAARSESAPESDRMIRQTIALTAGKAGTKEVLVLGKG